MMNIRDIFKNKEVAADNNAQDNVTADSDRKMYCPVIRIIILTATNVRYADVNWKSPLLKRKPMSMQK